jgi:hypothetical protein
LDFVVELGQVAAWQHKLSVEKSRRRRHLSEQLLARAWHEKILASSAKHN